MCIFVDEWSCKIEGDEKPLEVCRVCLEAKKIANEKMSAKKNENESILKEDDLGEERSNSRKENQREKGSDQGAKNIQKEEEQTKSDRTGPRLEGAEKDEDSTEKSTDEVKEIIKEMKFGSTYLLADQDRKLTHELLDKINSSEKRILFVTQKNPLKLKEKYNLALEDSLWLSNSNNLLAIPPSELDTIRLEIEMFLSEGGDFILIDGLEPLFSKNPGATIIRLFKSLQNLIRSSGTALILGFSPSSLDKKHISLINKKLDVKKIPLSEMKKAEYPDKKNRSLNENLVDESKEVPIGPATEEDLEFKEEDRRTKIRALKKLDKEFQHGDITVDEYISKRAVLTSDGPEEAL